MQFLTSRVPLAFDQKFLRLALVWHWHKIYLLHEICDTLWFYSSCLSVFSLSICYSESYINYSTTNENSAHSCPFKLSPTNFSIRFCSQVNFLLLFCSNSNIWPPMTLACGSPLADSPLACQCSSLVAWDSPVLARDRDSSGWAVFRWRRWLDMLSTNRNEELETYRDNDQQ